MSYPGYKKIISRIACGTLIIIGAIFVASYLYTPDFLNIKYYSANVVSSIVNSVKIIPVHISTPDIVRGVYMTSWVAGIPEDRNKIVELIDDTELNAVVIDVKDYTGKISYPDRIPDIEEFINELHSKNIYVIGRVTSFQDAYLVKKHPEWAVRKASDGEVWKDFKGISWLDVGAAPVWDYLVAIGKDAYEKGFDEINFDYIRFPSDGNLKDIFYPYSGNRKKSDVVKDFFIYLREHLKGQVISADLFGMTTTSKDDMGIGQLLENGFSYFDFVAPMVYPSHYPVNFDGYDNPNHYPYEIVKFSMDNAVRRAIIASTTPNKLRPWLQDFNYGGVYDATAVRKQIQAVYDSGLTSWVLWSPSNIYTKEALLPN